MAEGLLLVYTECPEGQDAEFNDWYDNIHAPDLLKVPGIVRVQRFRLHGEAAKQVGRDGVPRMFTYLCVFELESQDDVTRVKQEIERTREARADRQMAGVVGAMPGTYMAVSPPQVR